MADAHSGSRRLRQVKIRGCNWCLLENSQKKRGSCLGLPKFWQSNWWKFILSL